MEAAAVVVHTARVERNGAHGRQGSVMAQVADGRLKRHIIYTQIINDPVVALVVLDVIPKIKTDIYVSKGLMEQVSSPAFSHFTGTIAEPRSRLL